MKVLLLISSCFTSFNLWASTASPQSFKDFQVYAIKDISYSNSDFQGVTGAASSVELLNFGILDDREQLIEYSNRFSYSLYTKSLSMKSGSVNHGGVLATQQAQLENIRVEGEVTTRSLKVRHSSYVYFDSRPDKFDFDSITKSLFDYSLIMSKKVGREPGFEVLGSEESVGGYQVFNAIDGDGKIENVFEVDRFQNFVINAQNDPREYFIIINRSESIEMRSLDIKLIGGAEPSKVLFLFPNAKEVLITATGVSTYNFGVEAGIGLPGSIMAPMANVKFYNGLITGNLYAQNIFGSPWTTGVSLPGGQVNYAPFVCFDYIDCKSPYDIIYK